MYHNLESAEHSDSELSETHSTPTPDTTPLKRSSSSTVSIRNFGEGQAATVPLLSDDVDVRRSSRRRATQPDILIERSEAAGDSAAFDNVFQPNGTVSPAKKRKAKNTEPREVFHFEPPYVAASTQDKSSWSGFCELESDPAVFNQILRNLGVYGIKVQEVYSLEPELLDMLARPVHGLIFLFEYTDEAEEAEQPKECPQDIWFANQVVDNCCGTIALLNVINNIPRSQLLMGEQMQHFKDFTMPFTPAFRGDQAANCDFIKTAHNVYARQIDIWNADLIMEEKWTEAQKKKRKSKGRGGNRKSSRKAYTNSTYHFVAYMPIRGEMWRMDGLDDYAQSFGPCKNGADAWVSEIAPLLSTQMAAYAETGVQFSLLAIVPDEAATTRIKAAKNNQLLHAVESRLLALRSDWQAVSNPPVDRPSKHEEHDSFMDHDADEIARRLAGIDSLGSLVALHKTTLNQHQELQQQLEAGRSKTQVAETDATSDEVRALDRQNDYVPFIQKWLMMLAENQKLKDLVEAHQW